jgi:MFS family permease
MASKFAATLRHRDMRYVLSAYVVDDTASWGYTVVLAAYAYGRTGSTGWIALIACTRWVIGLIVSGYAGLLADRYDRARLIAASGAVCAVAMAGLAIVVGTDGPLWLLPVLSAADTALSSPVRAATGALVPDIVPEADLIAANGLFAILENVVMVLGPGIGGLLLLAGTPATAMAINAASYLIAAGLYLQVRTRSRGDAGTAEEGRIAQWTAGVRALGRSGATRLLTVFLGIGGAVYGASIVVYAPLSISFGTGANGYSYLLASSALGSVLAALLAERLSARTRLAPLLVGAIVVEAVPFWISNFVDHASIGALLQVLSGGGLVVLEVLAITALQRDLPRAVLGRALAATGAVVLATTVVGNLAASAVISSAGLSWALALIGIGFPLIALACLPVLIANDRATAEHTRSLQPVVELLERLDLFDGANRRVLEQLAGGSVRRTAQPGEVLISQGDDADALWLLASGRLQASANGVALPDVTAPAYVGELGLMNNAPRSATVTVSEPSDVVRIEADDFREAVGSVGSSTSLMTVAGERLGRTPRREARSRPLPK